MATRWTSQEVLRGALIVPVSDLDRTKPELQRRPPVPVVPRDRIPPPIDWQRLADEERRDMLRFASVHRFRGREVGKLAHLQAPILRTAAEIMAVSVKDLMVNDRRTTLHVSHARGLACWGLIFLMNMSTASVARYFKIDRSTVHNGYMRIHRDYPEQCAELMRRCLP